MSATPSPWKTLTGADAEQIYGNPAIRQWMEANGYSVGKYADLSKAPVGGSEQGGGSEGSADYMGVGKFLAEKGVSPQFFNSGGVNNWRVADQGDNALASGTYNTQDKSLFEKAAPMVLAAMATAGFGGFGVPGAETAGAGGGFVSPEALGYGGLGGAEAAALPASQIGAMDVAGAGLGAEATGAGLSAADLAASDAAFAEATGTVAPSGAGSASALSMAPASTPSWLSSLFGGAGAAGGAGGAAGAGAAGGSIWPAVIGGGASLLGGAMAANATSKAADIAQQSSRESLALQERIYNESMARQQPFLQGGTEDYNRLRALSKGGPEAQQNALQMDPGYQFRLQEGLDRLQHNAAARGGLISGQTLKGAQQYAQDYASNEYGNVYNRLANLANVGPQAAGVMSNLGQNYAQGASNTYNQMGENMGNAALARGSAYQNAFGGIANMLGRYYTGGTFSGQQPYKP